MWIFSGAESESVRVIRLEGARKRSGLWLSDAGMQQPRETEPVLVRKNVGLSGSSVGDIGSRLPES